jgi:hypothetical protein
MRTFGLLLLIAGIVGFVYFGDQLTKVEPVPEGEGLDVKQSLRYPAGKLEAGRYASIAAALFGILLIMFPKGRSV